MKLKIFRLGGKAIENASELVLGLQEDRYDEDKEVGFTISQISSHLIRGSFLEKRKRRLQVFDTSGESRIVELDSINLTKFEIFPKTKFLVLFDAQVGLSTFISRLALIGNFRLIVEPANLSLPNLVDFLKEEGLEVAATEVTGANLEISDEIVASLKLRGRIDLAAILSEKLLGLKASIVSAKLECLSDTEKFMFHWKETGNYDLQPSPRHPEAFLGRLLRFANGKSRVT